MPEPQNRLHLQTDLILAYPGSQIIVSDQSKDAYPFMPTQLLRGIVKRRIQTRDPL